MFYRLFYFIGGSGRFSGGSVGAVAVTVGVSRGRVKESANHPSGTMHKGEGNEEADRRDDAQRLQQARKWQGGSGHHQYVIQGPNDSGSSTEDAKEDSQTIDSAPH
jgi:hypothetical protein